MRIGCRWAEVSPAIIRGHARYAYHVDDLEIYTTVECRNDVVDQITKLILEAYINDKLEEN